MNSTIIGSNGLAPAGFSTEIQNINKNLKIENLEKFKNIPIKLLKSSISNLWSQMKNGVQYVKENTDINVVAGIIVTATIQILASYTLNGAQRYYLPRIINKMLVYYILNTLLFMHIVVYAFDEDYDYSMSTTGYAIIEELIRSLYPNGFLYFTTISEFLICVAEGTAQQYFLSLHYVLDLLPIYIRVPAHVAWNMAAAPFTRCCEYVQRTTKCEPHEVMIHLTAMTMEALAQNIKTDMTQEGVETEIIQPQSQVEIIDVTDEVNSGVAPGSLYESINDLIKYPKSESTKPSILLNRFDYLDRVRANRLINRGQLWHDSQVRVVKKMWKDEKRKREFTKAVKQVSYNNDKVRTQNRNKQRDLKLLRINDLLSPQAGPLGTTFSLANSYQLLAPFIGGKSSSVRDLATANLMEGLIVDSACIILEIKANGKTLDGNLMDLEQNVYLISKLARCKTWFEFIEFIYGTLLLRDKIGITSSISYIMKLPLLAGLIPQAEFDFSTIKEIGQLVSSPLGRSLINMVYGCLAMYGLGDLSNVARVEKLILVGAAGMKCDPTDDPLGAIILGVRNIYGVISDSKKLAAFISGDFSYLSKDAISIILMEAYELLGQYDTVVGDHDARPNFIPSLVDVSSYESKIEDVRRKLIKQIDSKSTINSMVNSVIQKLDDIVAKLSQMRDSLPRETPFGLAITGQPCVGKSTILTEVLSVLAQGAGLPDHVKHHYYATSGKFNAEGMTQEMHSFIEDDSQVKNPNIMTSSDVNVDQRLNRVNVTAFKPPMADVSEKGQSFSHAIDIVLTNDPYLNCTGLLSNDGAVAVLRRYIHVTVSVNPKYSRKGGVGIDPNLVPEGVVDDLQEFTVQRVIPIKDPNPLSRGLACNWETIATYKSKKEFFSFLYTSIKTHRQQQKKLLESIYKKEPMCFKCGLKYEVGHTCLVPQSDVVVPVVTSSVMIAAILFMVYFISYISSVVSDVKLLITNYKDIKDNYTTLRTNGRNMVVSVKEALLMKKTTIKLISIGAAIAVLGIAYNRWKTINTKPQGMVVSKDYPKRNNTTQISPFTPIIKSSTFEDVIPAIKNSMRKLIILHPDGVKVIVSAFPMSPDSLCTVQHPFPKDFKCDIVIVNSDNLDVNTNITVPITQDMIGILAPDLVEIRLPAAFRSIQKWIPALPTPPIGMELTFIHPVINAEGKYSVNEIPCKCLGLLENTGYIENGHTIKHVKLFKTNVEGVGYCGGVYVAKVGRNAMIVGMHVAGVNGAVEGCAIFLSSPLAQFWPGLFKLKSLPVQVQSCKILPLHPKSHIYQLPPCTLAVHGSIGYANKFHTSLRHTLLHDMLNKHGIPTLFDFPNFKYNTYDTDIPLDAVYSNILPTVTTKPIGFDLPMRAAEAYINYLESQDIKVSYNRGPLTLEESINGVLGEKGMDGLKMNTSVGFGHTGIKRDYIKSERPNAELTPIILEEVNNILNSLKDPTDPYLIAPILNGSLKDEPKKPGKLPRLFMAGPMAYTIVFRMFFLPLVNLIELNPYIFRIMIGCSPWGTDWDKIRTALFSNSFKFAGDYEKFDKKQLQTLIILIAYILCWLAMKYLNYSQSDCVILFTFIKQLANSVTVINGDLVTLFCGNPSGNPATSIVNSIYNILVYIAICLHLNIDWIDHFIAVYGDDLLASHNLEWFTQTLFSELSKELFQLKYTDPSVKDGPLPPFTADDKITFLGRSFGERYKMWDDGWMRLCPLKLESIAKMLHFEGNHLDPANSLIARHSEAVFEYAQHENYLELVTKLNGAVEEYGYEVQLLQREDILDKVFDGTFYELLSKVFL